MGGSETSAVVLADWGKRAGVEQPSVCERGSSEPDVASCTSSFLAEYAGQEIQEQPHSEEDSVLIGWQQSPLGGLP